MLAEADEKVVVTEEEEQRDPHEVKMKFFHFDDHYNGHQNGEAIYRDMTIVELKIGLLTVYGNATRHPVDHPDRRKARVVALTDAIKNAELTRKSRQKVWANIWATGLRKP